MDRAKKDCILVEAARAFARFGFKKASIDDIAKEAGVGKGTIYLAAESKEDLYYQVVHREIREWQAECAQAIDPRVRADQLLGILLGTAIEHLERRPLLLELMHGNTQALLPAWAVRFDELRALGRTNLVEVLRLGIKQKVFRENLDVETVAGLLQDFHMSAWDAQRRHATREKKGQAAARDDLIHRARVGLDLVLHGLRDPHHAMPALPALPA